MKMVTERSGEQHAESNRERGHHCDNLQMECIDVSPPRHFLVLGDRFLGDFGLGLLVNRIEVALAGASKQSSGQGTK